MGDHVSGQGQGQGQGDSQGSQGQGQGQGDSQGSQGIDLSFLFHYTETPEASGSQASQALAPDDALALAPDARAPSTPCGVRSKKWYRSLKAAKIRTAGRSETELEEIARAVNKRRRESAAKSRLKRKEKMARLERENEALKIKLKY